MGSRGPSPKRSDQRRRRNKPEVEVTEAAGAAVVDAPSADDGWHPVARRWFESLGESGQSVFYEPSDWATAQVVAESMSRDLLRVDEDGQQVPISGASMSAYLKAMSMLLVTEVDRRRASVELKRPPVGSGDGDGSGNVEWLDHARRRRSG